MRIMRSMPCSTGSPCGSFGDRATSSITLSSVMTSSTRCRIQSCMKASVPTGTPPMTMPPTAAVPASAAAAPVQACAPLSIYERRTCYQDWPRCAGMHMLALARSRTPRAAAAVDKHTYELGPPDSLYFVMTILWAIITLSILNP